MKTTHLQFLSCGALVLALLLSNVFAQNDGTRIKFASGKSSATVTGTVAKGGPDFYLVGAKAGQQMTVKVTGKVSFGIDTGGERLTADDGNTNWSNALPAGGDFKIKVFSRGGTQGYTLTISIAAVETNVASWYRLGDFYDGITMTSKESGDYGGMAIYLIQKDSEDFYALVTIAEGVLKRPVLVKVKSLSGDNFKKFSFIIPNENGSRKFIGTSSASGLTIDESGSKSVLKGKCGSIFSNMSVGTESGDVGGMEIFLTESDGQWFALVTSAQGVVLKPQLVEAKVTGTNFEKLEFTIPGEDNASSMKYTGTIGKNALTLNSAGDKTILRKQCAK